MEFNINFKEKAAKQLVSCIANNITYFLRLSKLCSQCADFFYITLKLFQVNFAKNLSVLSVTPQNMFFSI